MKENFQRAFEFTMKWEGTKFTDTKGDRGGATKMGLTLATMNRLELDLDNDGDVDRDDLYLVNREVVERVYRIIAWDAVKADDLPGGIDLIAADIAFNSGPRRFSRFQAEGWAMTIDGLIYRRGEFYRNIVKGDAGQGKFLKGWLNRNADSHRAAVECEE